MVRDYFSQEVKKWHYQIFLDGTMRRKNRLARLVALHVERVIKRQPVEVHAEQVIKKQPAEVLVELLISN